MDHLNYESATAASKWFNGKAPLPERAARTLDARFGATSLGVSWSDLLRSQRRRTNATVKMPPARTTSTTCSWLVP